MIVRYRLCIGIIDAESNGRLHIYKEQMTNEV